MRKGTYVGYPVRARLHSSARSRFMKRVSSLSRPRASSGSTIVGSASGFKAKTASKTKTKTKSLFTKIRTDGPMSDSYFRWPQKLPSLRLGKLAKLHSPQFYVQNAYGRIDCPIGKQSFIDATTGYPSIWSANDLKDIHDQAVVNSAGISTVNPLTQNVYLKSCTNEIMFTNQTNDVVHMQIYECVARRDINNLNFTQPGNAWKQGAFDQGDITTPFVVGSNPFQTPAFTNLWEVERVFDINLHTGGHHVHRSKSFLNHTLNYEVQQSIGNTSTALGKITRVSLVVIHGYPYNATTTKTDISTNTVAVDMVWRKQYEYFVFDRSTTALTFDNNLPASLSTAGEIINDLVGTVANTVIA